MPMVKKTYSITDKNDQWVKDQVATGRYATDSEYLRDLIRRDQEKHSEIERIRAALIEGEQSGISDRTPDEIREGVLKRLQASGKLPAE